MAGNLDALSALRRGFDVDEHVRDRALVSGWSNIDVWERNVDYATGELIPARST